MFNSVLYVMSSDDPYKETGITVLSINHFGTVYKFYYCLIILSR